jgi:predicted dehydrogenase
MKEYRVTFGLKYRTNEHPTWPKAHPDGWLTVIAENENMARRFTAALLATNWAFIYPRDGEHQADWDLYFKGELGRIEFSETP